MKPMLHRQKQFSPLIVERAFLSFDIPSAVTITATKDQTGNRCSSQQHGFLTNNFCFDYLAGHRIRRAKVTSWHWHQLDFIRFQFKYQLWQQADTQHGCLQPSPRDRWVAVWPKAWSRADKFPGAAIALTVTCFSG